MKIHIHNPMPKHFWFMENLFSYSLQDLGHEITDREQADIIINLQHDSGIPHEPNKKHILLDTEDWKHRPDLRSMYKGIERDFSPFYDKVWGFDPEHKTHEYLILGYHPQMEVADLEHSERGEIGLIGCATPRRRQLCEQAKNKFITFADWDYSSAMKQCSSFKINLHVHSYEPTAYTPWDRFARYIHNRIFFISEVCYCPFLVPMFAYPGCESDRIISYDEAMSIFRYSKLMRSDIINNLYNIYKQNYTMCKILGDKLCAIKPA